MSLLPALSSILQQVVIIIYKFNDRGGRAVCTLVFLSDVGTTSAVIFVLKRGFSQVVLFKFEDKIPPRKVAKTGLKLVQFCSKPTNANG